MAYSSVFATFEGQVNIKASLVEARKASYAAYSRTNGYVKEEIGNNTTCFAFPGTLDSSAFCQSETKFNVCKINVGNNYFKSMVDGTTRKDPREPALVHKEALNKFLHIWDGNLKQQVVEARGKGKTILFTGHSIGGAIAILATLASLEEWGKDAPIFGSTFGFPLVGDEVLARAVRRQGWANHFFNVVSRSDVFARTLLAPCVSVSKPLESLLPYWQRSVEQMNDDDADILMEPADLDFPMYLRTVLHHACALVNFISATNMEPTNKLIASLKPMVKLSPYRPFGYYLFCSDKGALCVENYEAVLPILFYSLATCQDQASISDHTGYDRVFHANTNIVMLEGFSKLPLSQGASTSAIEIQLGALGLGIQNTGARLALRAAGEVEDKLIENQNKLKAEMVKLEEAGHMTKLKEYRNKCVSHRNMGYYDAFKEQKESSDFHANLNRLNLAAFYDRLEDMVETHQVPDDSQFIEDLIKEGTEYRRLVEPLDIANYYRLGKHEDSGHYMKNARPRRYKALEKWLADIQLKANNQALLHFQPDITKDSCFWAYVEEISWMMSNPREDAEAVRAKVNKFQNDVKQMMDRNELRVEEVMIGESSFVKWWMKLSPQDQQAFPIYSIFLPGRN
ncbi:hypothetical protein SUGI_0970270 [Cryptomeria japonica]|uniref:protein EDS1 n=1 Tax=Cryptomeria japonica TaxID=3369 RepID=UPI002414B143|nr:protein EDS1 [Cryptomeria japonica]GLJ46055.1 hypothetical protein SUGI_0970270 [Cryptomeria japonica]